MSTAAEIENLRPVFLRVLQAHQLSPKDLRNDLCHISVSDKGVFQCANCYRCWSSNFSWISLHLRDLEITYRWKKKCKHCDIDCIPTFTIVQMQRMFEKAVKYYIKNVTSADIENLRPVFLRILQAHQLSPKDMRIEECQIAVPDKASFNCGNCKRVWSVNFSWVCFHLKDLEITYRWKMKCKHCNLDCIPKFSIEQLEKMFEKAVKLAWFGTLQSAFCYTRAHETRTYCLKPILNGYEHPCHEWDSNPQTLAMKSSALPI